MNARYALAAAAAALVLSAWFGATTAAAATADPAAGARLAQQWCANCHVVNAGGGANPNAAVPQGPPPFTEIARRLDPGQLRAFLSHPHPPMPDMALTRAEIGDLIAYIETLK